MNKKFLKPAICIILICFFTFFYACSTTSRLTSNLNENGTTNKITTESFILDNGIPVILKVSDTAKVNTLELYFSFGASQLKENQLGYLGFLMECVKKNSARFRTEF